MKKIVKTRRGPKFDCVGRIEEFRRSGLLCDRVYYTQKTAASCRNSLNQALKRMEIKTIRVIQSGNYVILLKLDL